MTDSANPIVLNVIAEALRKIIAADARGSAKLGLTIQERHALSGYYGPSYRISQGQMATRRLLSDNALTDIAGLNKLYWARRKLKLSRGLKQLIRPYIQDKRLVRRQRIERSEEIEQIQRAGSVTNLRENEFRKYADLPMRKTVTAHFGYEEYKILNKFKVPLLPFLTRAKEQFAPLLVSITEQNGSGKIFLTVSHRYSNGTVIDSTTRTKEARIITVADVNRVLDDIFTKTLDQAQTTISKYRDGEVETINAEYPKSVVMTWLPYLPNKRSRAKTTVITGPLNTGGCADEFLKNKIDKELWDKKSLIWIKNWGSANKGYDKKCLLACLANSDMIEEGILVKDKNRVTPNTRRRIDQFNVTGIPGGGDYFPLEYLPKFEEMNKVRIYVYEYDAKSPGIKGLYQSTHSEETAWRSRYFLRYLDEEQNVNHCAIVTDHRNLNVKWSESTAGKNVYSCAHCGKSYKQKKRLEDHTCTPGESELIESKLPIQFKKWSSMAKAPIYIVYDTEALNQNCNDDSLLRSKKLADQEVFVVSYKIGGMTDQWIKENLNTPRVGTISGPDCMVIFLKFLIELNNRIQSLAEVEREIIWGTGEKTEQYYAQSCMYCHKGFNSKDHNLYKVADHCHLSGSYRGAAHRLCNLIIGSREASKRFIPVIAHNQRGYDAHFIFAALEKIGISECSKVSVIPNTTEKYLSFTLTTGIEKEEVIREKTDDNKGYSVKHHWTLRFIDWFCFQSSSLDNLIKMVPAEQRINLNKIARDPEKRKLALQKMAFPYEWMDDESKSMLPGLPEQKHWYNRLKRESLSDEDFKTVQKVWTAFDMKTFADYIALYLRIDVYGLADVVEFFREQAIAEYRLDPLNFYGLPSFAMQSALLLTEAKLDPVPVDMFRFFSDGITGGVSYISHRNHKANNPICGEVDPEKPISYIRYWDANQLYGDAMTRKLPARDFKWIEAKQFPDLQTILDTDWENSSTGHTLEVSLRIPESLHDSMNDYPPVAIKREVKFDELCPLTKAKNKDVRWVGQTRLMSDLLDKDNITLDVRLLQHYLQLGIELKGITRGVSYKQEDWLQPYIEHNRIARQKSIAIINEIKGDTPTASAEKAEELAKHTFLKQFYKDMSNIVYGKTEENIFRRMELKMCRTPVEMLKAVSDPLCKGPPIKFHEGLIAVPMTKKKSKLDIPIYTGFCITQLSKLIMSDFVYNALKPAWGAQAIVMATDTDSLIVRIETPSVDQDILDKVITYKGEQVPLASFFDHAGYPKDHPLYNPSNEGIYGKFKPEVLEEMSVFTGLRSKMYFYSTASGHSKSTAKGIQKAERDSFTHEEFINALNGGVSREVETINIRSKKHKIGVYSQMKVGLNGADCKRYIQPDGVSTLAYGHYRIGKMA